MENQEKLNIPREYEDIMKKQLGEDYLKYIDALKKEPVRGLRVNTKKISIEEFLKRTNLSLEKLSFCDDGFLLNTDEKLGNTPEQLSGLCYLQEPSSMTPVVASEIEKENRPLKVLDLCASPGGKTGQIALRVSDESIIFSNEIIKSRADVLFSNVERQGFKNVVIINEEPKNLLKFQGYFDYVFVDAPCSGEGMFRKNPETINEWSESNVKLCAGRQKEILEIAEKLVSAGGKLIYSTCTFSNEEDEEIVEWFLNNFNYEISEVSEKIKNVTSKISLYIDKGENARKFYPFVSSGEGQFLCCFKNLDIERNVILHKKKHFRTLNLVGRSNFLLFDEFAKSSLKKDYTFREILELGNTLYLKPSELDEKVQTAIDDLKLISIGVKLGSIEKGRFEPNHNIFMALYDDFKEKIELSEDELKKYLHGEELNKNVEISKGFAVVTYNGYAIGGVKVVGNRLKNLYPRGLRI